MHGTKVGTYVNNLKGTKGGNSVGNLNGNKQGTKGGTKLGNTKGTMMVILKVQKGTKKVLKTVIEKVLKRY